MRARTNSGVGPRRKWGSGFGHCHRISIQENVFLQAGGNVLFGDVADVLADQRFDFELEAVLQHHVDFLLPRLLVREPRILRDLAGAFDVLLVELDLDAGLELASLVVVAAQAEKAGGRNRHPAGFVGQVDRSLLEDAVDVVSPRIVIEQAVDGQLQFVVQPVQHAPHAARRLAAAVSQDAVVLFPEFVLVEPPPHRVLFDVQDELGGVLLELHDLGLDDRRNAVAARPHA